MHNLPLALLCGLVGMAVALGTRAVIGHRYRERRQIECAWRGFDKPGRWKHGLVTVGRGRIHFQPRWGSMGTRIARGPEVVLDVESIDPDEGIRPGLAQLWCVNPRLHILTLRTANGPIELAMLPKRVPQVLELLGT